MNTKPLSEWTAKEIVEECDRHDCCSSECRCYNSERKKCRLFTPPSPACWDLSESPRWTEQDKEDAKALKRLIPDAYIVWRYSTSSSLQLYDEYNNYILSLNDCFATLPLRENVTLDEIIGGRECETGDMR